jgi:putative transport protein
VNGLSQVGLTVLFWAVGVVAALSLTWVFDLSPAEAGGIFAGGLTESAALGTAGDAIAGLAIDAPLRQQLGTELAVAFAVSYIVGIAASIWAVSWLGPRLMRADLAAECRQLETELGVHAAEVGVFSAYRAFITRAYRIPPSLAGQSADKLERAFVPRRAFVERLRRGPALLSVEPDMPLEAGDHVAISAPYDSLASESNPLRAAEVDDGGLLDIPSIEVDVLLTSKAVAGHTLAEIIEVAARDVATRGVFLRRIVRGQQELPLAGGTVLERGDVVTLTGVKPHVAKIAARIGVAQWPTDASDLAAVAATICIGGLIGLLSVRVGGFDLGLSMAVGVLLGGLLLGWLRSVHPVLGRVTPGGLWILDSLGLAGFLAAVAINAAPTFVQGLRESGAVFVVAGLVLGTLPHIVTTLVGRYVFRVHPGLVLGIISGAGTIAPALAAVQETARSNVPALAYGVSYAVGNVLLALAGSVIVSVLAD